MRSSVILLFLQLWGHVVVSSSQNVCSTLPDVPHGLVLDTKSAYQEGDVIHFTCEPGYKSTQTIKYVCTNNGWLAVRLGTCYSCSTLPDVPHAFQSEETQKNDYQVGDMIQFTCAPGYTLSQTINYVCTNDGWLAIQQGRCVFLVSGCEPPPADGGITIKGLPENDDPIVPDHVITFSCDVPGKSLNGSSVLICGEDGQWSHPFPSCKDQEKCRVAGVPSNVHLLTDVPNNELKKGQSLRFECRQRGHFLRGNDETECLANGEWSHPFPTCGVPRNCGTTPTLRNGNRKGYHYREYRHNDKVEYYCDNPYALEGGPYKTCIDGEWTGEMSCVIPSGCGRPPPLQDGDTTGITQFQYGHNERVEYSCQNYYTMEGEPYKTCYNGEWIGEMRCLKPCAVDIEAMSRQNIAFRYSYKKKLYAPHDDELEFMCVGRSIHDGTLNMRQKCLDGVIHLPTCISRF